MTNLFKLLGIAICGLVALICASSLVLTNTALAYANFEPSYRDSLQYLLMFSFPGQLLQIVLIVLSVIVIRLLVRNPWPRDGW
ncbi:hypothetical protein EON81_27780 [bacterium]|nr:MAG: hypothetical protein EON81_27780 [bacterium]